MIEGDNIMTEETSLEVVPESTEAPQDDVLQAETVFLVVKDKNGLFRALTDVSTKISADRTANLIDIRNACRDIASSIQVHETAQVVVAAIMKANEPQSTNN